MTPRASVLASILASILFGVLGSFANAQDDLGKLQTTGSFGPNSQGGISFTDSADDKKYIVIKTLHDQVTPHLNQTVEVNAKVKPTANGKAHLMVHIISIQIPQ